MAYKRRDAGGGREMYGNYMISGGYPHKVYSPKGDKPGNKTEMRLFCAVDPSGEFSPQVVVADEPTEGISDSFHSRECVAWLGSKKMQFVTETSDFPATKISPARLFFNSIGELVEQEGKKKFAEWAGWLEWEGGLQLPLCKMMVQGILLMLNGEQFLDKRGKPSGMVPVVLVMQRSATVDMEANLTTPLDENEPLSAENSAMGDITSPAGGHVLSIQMFHNKDKRARYSVGAKTDAKGKVLPPMPINEDYVRAQFVPWDKLLRVETAKWQIDRLAETFDPASVDYVFSKDSDYAKLIPEHCKGSFNELYEPSSHPSAAVPKHKAPSREADDAGDEAPAWENAPAEGVDEVDAEAVDAGLVGVPADEEAPAGDWSAAPAPSTAKAVQGRTAAQPPARAAAPKTAPAKAGAGKVASDNPVLRAILAEKEKQLAAKGGKV